MYCYCKWSVLEFPDIIMSLLMYSGTGEIISKIMVLWVKKADDEVAFKLIFFFCYVLSSAELHASLE